jgi:peptidoglycan hydrolase-like protein with peptidoglycan-binding domain
MSFHPSISGVVELKELDSTVLKWVQSQLNLGGYDVGKVDGLFGPKTAKAFAEFKKDNYLTYPELISNATLAMLMELKPREEISEQKENLNQKPLANGGSKSGSSTTLPVVGLVYSNEWILPGTFITWGEMTKNLTRRPTQAAEINNIHNMARTFGVIREKFGSPLGVTSGYRPAHLGIGVRGSQHIPGRAVDIYPLNGNFSRLLEVIKQEPTVKGIGLGQAKGFLHVDIRPGSRVIFRY